MEQPAANRGGERTVLRVDLGERSYPIHLAPGALRQAVGLLKERCAGGVLVIADAAVADHYAAPLLAGLQASGISAGLATFQPGEASKSITTCQNLWRACAEHGIDRSGTIVGLGGGVSGDMAGFVAATWMRGVAFVQIPTTLLAMVDSAVGGKTGVNSDAGKNLIGAFKQPDLVIADPEVLATMDQREYAAGLAEVAKYGVIRDPDFLSWQEAHAAELVARDSATVSQAVATSCAIKAAYVAEDEYEHGVRAHLNYGHTFGHAIERDTGYRRWLHGEAVAIGMGMAIDLAARIGLLEDPELAERQHRLLETYGLPTRHRCPDPGAAVERLCAAVRLDKKRRAGESRFVLPRSAGAIEIVTDPEPSAVAAAFAAAIDSAD